MSLKWLDSNTTEDGHRIYSSTGIIKDNLKTADDASDLVPYIEKTGDTANLGTATVDLTSDAELYFTNKSASCSSNLFTVSSTTTENVVVKGHGFSIGEKVTVSGDSASGTYYVMSSDYGPTNFKLTTTFGGSVEQAFSNASNATYSVKSAEPFVNYRIAAYKQLPAPGEVALSEYWPVINPSAAKFRFIIEVPNAFTNFTLPLTLTSEPGGGTNYNFAVDWGDSTRNFVYKQGTYDSTNTATHTYVSAGLYTITIVGVLEGFSFNNTVAAGMLLEVLSWGQMKFNGSGGGGGLGNYFYGCKKLTNIPTTNTNIADRFNGTSNNLNFMGFFYLCELFNPPLNTISNWVTTRVVNMVSMFDGAKLFNLSLNTWDTSNVTNMRAMFQYAEVFNQPLNNWNTSNVTDMSSMFRGAKEFNQNINSWNVNKVTTIQYMFAISGSRLSVSYEIYGTHIGFPYYYPVPGYEMKFNQPLSNWFNNSPQIVNISWAFQGCTSFDRDISSWKIGNVTDMTNMFQFCKAYNNGEQSLSYDANSWNTSKVTSIQGMFAGATAFKGNGVNTWDLTDLRGQTSFSPSNSSALAVFYNSGLTQSNYVSILSGWASKLNYTNPSTKIIYFDGRPGSSIPAERKPLQDKGWFIYDNSTGGFVGSV